MQNGFELDSRAQQKLRAKSVAAKSEAASVVMQGAEGDDEESEDGSVDMNGDEAAHEEDDDDDDAGMAEDEAVNAGVTKGSLDHLSTHSAAVLPGSDEHIMSGQYVTLVLADVPLLAVQRLTEGRLFTWFSLFEHEMKVSVLNFNIQRIDGSDEPIKSKQEVIFMVRS